MKKAGLSRACGLGVAVLLAGCGVGSDDGFTLPAGDTDEPASMSSFNDVMTVTQLVDIVTFLEANYEIEPYRRTEYPSYGP